MSNIIVGRNYQKRVGADLTEGSIPKLLSVFVIPLILGNLLQQLYNAVDVMIIGRYMGSIGTVGVSNGGEYAGLMTYAATGFSSAGQIYIAQMVGRNDRKGIGEIASTLFSFLIIIAVGLSLLGVVTARWFMWILNCPQEAVEQAVSYQCWSCLGFPAIFGYNAVCGILRGMGESGKPLAFIAVSAVTNIFFDLLLVAGLHMEADGTAIATVASQYAAFLAALTFMLRKKEDLDVDLKCHAAKLYPEHLKILVKLGLPLTAQSMLVHFSQLFCTALINNYGVVEASANSIGNKINRITNTFTSGVTAGAGAMVGQNIGARKFDRVKKTVYCALIGALIFSTVFSMVSIFGAEQIVMLFTKTEENAEKIIALGAACVRLGVITLMLAAVQGAFCAVISGSGYAKLQFFYGVLDSIILRIGISLLFAYVLDMGVVGFFLGNGLARLGPTMIGIYYFYSNKWKKRNLLSDHL